MMHSRELQKILLPILVCVTVSSCVAANMHDAGAYQNQAVVADPGRWQPSRLESATGKPSPPVVFLDTTYVRPSGKRISVSGGASASRSLESALESAQPGDMIELEAGATFSGNFTLPNKGASASWIVIRSSTSDQKLPDKDSRVSPGDAALMPKIMTPNGAAVLTAAPGAHHYRFIGIEFTMASGVKQQNNLIKLGEGSEREFGQLPHDIIIDRCYIHGSSSQTLRRAIALNSVSTAIINSYISDVHEVGADSQAICGWNGPGPYKIVNNYLEAAGENIMFGGADPSIKELVPSDIEFRRNHCFKPLTWKRNDPTYAGTPWTIKNLLELKNAQRIVIEGNVFENNWVDAQTGYAILLKCQNQDGNGPWCLTQDVEFTNNIVRHSSSALNLLGFDPYKPSGRMKRISIRNNLFEDLGGSKWGGNGNFLTIAATDDVSIDHNTALQTGTVITSYGDPSKGFFFTNNLVRHNQYGVKGDGVATGQDTLDKYFPGHTFKKNVLVGASDVRYPAENFKPVSLEQVAFAELAKSDYRLTSNSAYRGAGTDGRDIGCDMAALMAAVRLANSAPPQASKHRDRRSVVTKPLRASASSAVSTVLNRTRRIAMRQTRSASVEANELAKRTE